MSWAYDESGESSDRFLVALVLLIPLTASAALLWYLGFGAVERCSARSSSYTCRICGSTRSVGRNYLLGYIPLRGREAIHYRSPAFATCNHDWSSGISCAVRQPVPDGILVLVRQDAAYGAFVLRNQKASPERAEYQWWYRPDGLGVFDANDPSVITGHGTTPGIEFGPFSISWSTHGDGSGWLYYRHWPGDAVKPEDLHLCVTDHHSIEGIDAAESKWKYKATPVD